MPRKTSISCKGPDLSRRSCDLTDAAGRQKYYNDGNHCVGASVALRSVVEQLDPGVVGRRIQDAVDISEGKDESHSHQEGQSTIDD